MTPPQLPRDVPVPDVGQPVLPGLLEALGQDPRPSRPGRLERARRERPCPDEPLRLEPRLDDIAAPLAAPDDHLVGRFGGKVASCGEVGDDRVARGVAIHPVVAGAGVRDRPVVGEDRRRGEAVAQAGLMVVVVVGRRDLDGTGPEASLHDVVGDDRHVTIDERDARRAADQRRVARIVGMDRDRCVAEDRLGPGGGDRDRRVGSGSPVAGSIRW